MKNYPLTLTLYLLLFTMISPLLLAGFMIGIIILPVCGGFKVARGLFTRWHESFNHITKQD